MVNARSDFANSPVYGRLVGTIIQLVDAIAVSPNYAKERTTPVACMCIMKSSEISLALGRQAVNGFLEQTFIFEHPNLLVLQCLGVGSRENEDIARGLTSSGRSAKMRSPSLMLRLAKSPSPISGVDLTSYKSGRRGLGMRAG